MYGPVPCNLEAFFGEKNYLYASVLCSLLSLYMNRYQWQTISLFCELTFFSLMFFPAPMFRISPGNSRSWVGGRVEASVAPVVVLVFHKEIDG